MGRNRRNPERFEFSLEGRAMLLPESLQFALELVIDLTKHEFDARFSQVPGLYTDSVSSL